MTSEPSVACAAPVAPASLVALATPAGEASRWLAALRAALPGARVERIEELDESARRAVRVAIVADADPAALRALPNLVWVQSLWAGVEGLVRELGDTDVGIVRYVDPRLADTMAEAVLAWTLWLHRDGPRYAGQQRTETWLAHAVVPAADRVVGVLGLGELGTAAASRLAANGFDVRGWARSPRARRDVPDGVSTFDGERGLREVLAASDVVVILLPLTDGTRDLLDADRLSGMKPGAALVNFARGPVVDTDALLAALDAGPLGHAVLDVFDAEPLPASDPLWHHSGVTVLPHVSGPTDTAAAARIAAGNVRRFLADGTLPPFVDAGRGY